MELNHLIKFIERRCNDCGRFWAIEEFGNYGNLQCPFCAGRKIEEARNRVAAVERSMIALKSNFTRLKKIRNPKS